MLGFRADGGASVDFRCMFERELHAADPNLDHCYTIRWPVSEDDRALLALDPELSNDPPFLRP